MSLRCQALLLSCLIVGLAQPASARVTRIVVENREAPAYGGKIFGAAGQYEILSGHVFGEIDPADPANTIITDLDLAPRNANGKVEYSATFQLAKPVEMTKASGVLVYEVANRGMVIPNGPDAAGHVFLASGWQGDIPPRPGMQTIAVPVARNADGTPVTGPALATFSNMLPGTRSLPITGGLGTGTPRPEPVSLDTSQAHLTRRVVGGPPIPVPPGEWAFADCTDAPFPGKPDPHALCLRDGFRPSYLYELVYTAKDPLVLGIGFAATRDINAFFREAAQDDAGTPNPVAGAIHKAIAIGFSQSGNFLRSFVDLGFNRQEHRPDGKLPNQNVKDAANRIVWDGIESAIAGRLLALNIRFAAPGGAAGLDEPGSEGILWWGDYTDTQRGLPRGGLLDRCRATATCPKVFELFGASEFWGLRMSPDLVGTDAKADIPLPDEVRRYYFPGVTHGGGQGGFALKPEKPPLSVNGACGLPGNPNPSADTTRALTVALIDWVTKGTEPPPSRFPTIKDGQLVLPTAEAMGFPTIPATPPPDGKINPFVQYAFGPGFHSADLSGTMTVLPPKLEAVLPSLVARVDADGNEIGGIPSPLMQAPLGTYLGWNVTAGGYFRGQGCGFAGGFVPFAETKAERLQSGDPRPSLEERYGTHDAYVAKVREAAERLVGDRFLLQPYADRIVQQAQESRVLVP
jgi:hypothetical protein